MLTTARFGESKSIAPSFLETSGRSDTNSRESTSHENWSKITCQLKVMSGKVTAHFEISNPDVKGNKGKD